MKKIRFFALSLILMQLIQADDQIDQAVLNKIISSSTGFDMPIKDEARNVVIVNKSTLTNKGYQTLDEALKMAPLITFSNNGFGENIDLRGQGGEANMGVKVLLNRVPINLLDSSHGVTPLSMINLEDVESIEIIPGGGAVVYGNGTRGGVVNIVTKSHPKDFASINLKGGSYETSNGLFGRLDLSGGKRIGNNFFLKLDGSVANTNGYRKLDSLFNYYLAGEGLWNINENQSLDLNVSYSYSKTATTPSISLQQVKEDRRASGDGRIISEDNFVNTSLDYKAKFGNHWDLDILGYYQMSDTAYPTNVISVTKMGIKVPYNQSGSGFLNQASGGNFKLKYTTDKNTLILGYDVLYQDMSRKSNNHYVLPDFMTLMKLMTAAGITRPTSGTRPSAPPRPSSTGTATTATEGASSGTPNIAGAEADTMIGSPASGAGSSGTRPTGTQAMSSASALDHFWKTDLEAFKLANAFYAYDKYEFSDYFELSGGARYENSLYYLTENKFTIAKGMFSIGKITSGQAPQFKTDTNRNNYALELTPNFKYSDSGNVYLKYERGFITPSPNQMMNSDKNGLYYNDLKPETYDTFELGWKDEFNFSYISATLYYTLSHNEININQIEHGSVWEYTNLDKTQRLGIEVVAYQDFFQDRFHFNESIAYIYNTIMSGDNEGKNIPLVKDYKITLNLAYDIIKSENQLLSVLFNNSFFGPALDNSYAKIDPYILSNLGLNYKYKGFRFDLGIQNLFNAEYYLDQLATSSDEYIPAGYIPAPGRTYYAELRYEF